jgi:hypothetical protein
MLLTEKAARPICAHRGQGDLGHRADSEPQQEKCHARKPVEYREIRVKGAPPYVALCQRKGACDPKKGCNCSTGQSCRDRGNGNTRWISSLQHGCIDPPRQRTTHPISSLWERVLEAGYPQQRQKQRAIDGHGMIRSRHCHACA